MPGGGFQHVGGTRTVVTGDATLSMVDPPERRVQDGVDHTDVEHVLRDVTRTAREDWHRAVCADSPLRHSTPRHGAH